MFFFQVQQRLYYLEQKHVFFLFVFFSQSIRKKWDTFLAVGERLLLTATVIFPRIRSGMGPWILFFSFSAQVPISSMAMNTSVCTQTRIHIQSNQFSSGAATGELTESFILQAVTPGANMDTNLRLQIVWVFLTDKTQI